MRTKTMLVILNKEPASIKLFGTTIALTSDAGSDGRPARDHVLGSDTPDQEPIDGDKSSEREPAENEREIGALDVDDLTASSCATENPETDHLDGEENEMNASRRDQKIQKKPDKQIPCPRCDSANTKFCYYNNYNANQPRHFCRGCQRYWTAGGTMRNVPVGSGRRRSKGSSTSQCCPDNMFDARSYGTMLSFGSGFPGRNLVESAKYCLQNSVQSRGIDNGDDCSSVSSSVTALSSTEKRTSNKLGLMLQNVDRGFQSQASHSRFPVSFYSASSSSDWGCTRLTLGKHARDGKTMAPYFSAVGRSEETRYKDGNYPENGSTRNSEVMHSKVPFRTSPPNAAGYAHIPEMSSVLQANPAAMSRSMNFQESS